MESIKKIICPVDFSEGSEVALERAADLAKALGAEVELLHVYQLPILALPDAPITANPEYVTALTNRAQDALNDYGKKLASQGVVASTSLIEGNPAAVIVERAQKTPASMVVLGTHGRSGFRRFLLGSVTERVVRMASVPVMTVHLPQ